MNILSPSLLSIDFNHIERNAKVLDEAGVKWFHLDVMDGTFVRNISFGPPVIKCIRKITESFFDVHLMINEPIRYIDAFADAGADMLTVHYEACKNLQETIDAVKAAGMKVGVAVNPETPVHWLEYYINQVDMVIVAVGVRTDRNLLDQIEDMDCKVIHVGDANGVKNGYLGIREGYEAGLNA